MHESTVKRTLRPQRGRLFITVFFGLFVVCFAAQAHIGSPNVFFEGKAGARLVHVIIRPPPVVPGLAEIAVRVEGAPVQRVTVLPVYSKAGRVGAPPPDEAKLVRGETNLYAAALWLMKSGAYIVEVNVEGVGDKGTLAVPVNSIATNTRPMARGVSVILSALGVILFAAGLKIAGAAFGESRLDPGTLPTIKDRWRGRRAMALTAGVLCLLLFGGKKWWDYEDRNYRNNLLYKPLPVSTQVRTEHDQHILRIAVDRSEHRGQWTPLLPDHGKMMHLFLVRDGTPKAFAHLHPIQRTRTEFEAPLPPLPAGQYFAYADVTHEDGFSETLTARAEIPQASLAMKRLWLGNSAEPICSASVAQMLATNLFFPPDLDDSWQMDNAVAGAVEPPQDRAQNGSPRIASVGSGYKMVWENAGTLLQNQNVSLRFKLVTPDDQPAPVEPYMGMPGHAVVRREDGAVFAHVHPDGTFSMAAQEFFVKGKLPKQIPPGEQVSLTSESAPFVPPEWHDRHTNAQGIAQSLTFPYAFPEPGSYRLWIQAKSQGKILTGVFDTTVGAAK
jgi:hypothetical protein